MRKHAAKKGHPGHHKAAAAKHPASPGSPGKGGHTKTKHPSAHHKHHVHHVKAKHGRNTGKRALAAPACGDSWVLGGNDELATCSAVAVANSLYAATGIWAGDDEILALHLAAGGGDDGASIEDVLEALEGRGLEGARPAGIWPVALVGGTEGLVLGLALTGGRHSVFSPSDGFAATWGGTAPLAGRAEESWLITW